MLVLSRKPGESIVIDGRIHLKIVRVEGEVVKVGIEAPSDVPVHRKEVYDEIQLSNQQALTRPAGPLPKLPKLAAPNGKGPRPAQPAKKPAPQKNGSPARL